MEHLDTNLVDIKFGYIYSLCTFVFHLLLCPLILSLRTADSIGLQLTTIASLSIVFVVEVIKVYIAKRQSGHPKALALPVYSNVVKGDITKGPFLRRTVLRIKKLIFRIAPLKTILHGILDLLGFWLLAVYVTVCFGASVWDHHYETGSFCALLAVLTGLPVILTYGPGYKNLVQVFLRSDLKETDPLGLVLYRNALGGLLGAWLGAVPIPLDWDRPWQAWPVTCVLGTVAGSVVGNVVSLIAIRGVYVGQLATNLTKQKKRN